MRRRQYVWIVLALVLGTGSDADAAGGMQGAPDPFSRTVEHRATVQRPQSSVLGWIQGLFSDSGDYKRLPTQPAEMTERDDAGQKRLARREHVQRELRDEAKPELERLAGNDRPGLVDRLLEDAAFLDNVAFIRDALDDLQWHPRQWSEDELLTSCFGEQVAEYWHDRTCWLPGDLRSIDRKLHKEREDLAGHPDFYLPIAETVRAYEAGLDNAKKFLMRYISRGQYGFQSCPDMARLLQRRRTGFIILKDMQDELLEEQEKLGDKSAETQTAQLPSKLVGPSDTSETASTASSASHEGPRRASDPRRDDRST